MTSKEAIIQQLKNLKGKPLKQKVEHIATYFWQPILIALVLLIGIGSFVVHLITAKDTLLYVNCINSFAEHDAAQTYLDAFADDAGIDRSEFEVQITVNFSLDQQDLAGAYNTAQAIAAQIAAGSMDVMAGDRMLAGIFGAVAGGAGVALVLMNGASTGGTDMLAMVLARLIPGSNVSNLIFLLDGLVVVTGALIFGIPSTLYAILGVFLMARVTDVVLTGQKDARMIYCISAKNKEIASEIMERANRGVSRLQITGMYTGEEKNMLMCVVSRRQIVLLKRIIRSHDPRAFVIISNVSDVRGEGFAADILEND